MRYLSLFTPARHAAGAPPNQECAGNAEMGKLIEESIKSGVLLATGGLMPVAKGGARIRRTGDNIAVLDGPFAETREFTGGFAILQAQSREEAIEVTRTFLKIAGDGEAELHEIQEP